MELTVRVNSPTIESGQEQQNDPANIITVTVEGDNGLCIKVVMERRQFMFRLKWLYAEIVEEKAENLIFEYRGQIVRHMDTPEKLNMPNNGTRVKVTKFKLQDEPVIEIQQKPKNTQLAKHLIHNLLDKLSKI